MTSNRLIRIMSVAAGLLLAGCAAQRPILLGGDGVPYPPAEPKEEEIYHVPTGLRISLDQLMEMISCHRVVYVGESHTNVNSHRVQLEIIRQLQKRFPGRVGIGMEMFRNEQQEALDRWQKGQLSEMEFLRDSKWYENWGSDFGYYRGILTFAKEEGLDVIALKPPADLDDAVRKSSFENLPSDVKSQLPQIGEPDPYAEASLKAVYQGHIPSQGMVDAFRRIQTVWEEAMAERIVTYLTSPRGEGKKMVVIVGGGHVQYGFGIPKKVMRRLVVPYSIIMPEEVSIPEDKVEELTMDVTMPILPLFKSDFVWWVPYADLEDKRMKIGIAMADREGKIVVEQVEKGSPGEKAGVQVGDEIVSFDGVKVTTFLDLRLLVGGKKEGDQGTLVVRRAGSELSLPISFFLTAKPNDSK